MSATRGQTAIMVADFDSVRQAGVWKQTANPDDAMEVVKACLRIVDALGARVVLTAPQVLDGTFFLLLGPAGVRTVLARDPGQKLPLTITCTDESLAAWLTTRRALGAGFDWSCRDPLASLGLDEAEVLARQQLWVDAAEAGEVVVQRPGGGEPGEFPLKQVFRDALAPIPGLEARCAELAEEASRSKVFTMLGRNPAPGSHEATLLDWWSWAYAEALARQHDAQWLEFRPSATVNQPSSAAEQRSTLRIEGSLLENLGDISSYAYAAVVQQSRAAHEEWARGRFKWAIRSLSMIVREQSATGLGWRASVVRSGLWAAALTLLAVLSILAMVFPNSRWLLPIPVLAILLTGVPWGHLRTLLERRPHALDPVLHLKG